MKKTEIRVTIDSVEKQQRAIEILERYGERMGKNKNSFEFSKYNNSLIFGFASRYWWIGYNNFHSKRPEITLDELEKLLKTEK